MKTSEQRVHELYDRLVYQHQDAHIYMRDVLSDIEKMVDQAIMAEREQAIRRMTRAFLAAAESGQPLSAAMLADAIRG